MASIGEDTYNWGYSEGKEDERKELTAQFVVKLINSCGWTIQEAFTNLDISEDIRSEVEDKVRAELGL